MESDLKAHLLEAAAEFGTAAGLSDATVGRMAANDWRFFRRLRDEATFTARKYDEVMQWFSDNWPDGSGWPEGVPRPDRRIIPTTP